MYLEFVVVAKKKKLLSKDKIFVHFVQGVSFIAKNKTFYAFLLTMKITPNAWT